MINKLFLMVGGVVVAGTAVLFMSVDTTVTVNGMTAENTDSIEEGAALADVQVPAEFTPEAQMGGRIFAAKCAVCHGSNAAGQNGIAPPLINDIYRPGHHGEGAFISAAMNGVTSHHWNFGNMPKVEGVSRADIKNIVTFIRELQRENGIN